MILAIDPGNEKSAYCVIGKDLRPITFGKIPNELLRDKIKLGEFEKCNHITIEMIGHYGTGMSVGKTVFDTCFWIGRYMELLDCEPEFIFRKTVAANICGNSKANDSNIVRALIDRFAYGVPNNGKGIVNKKVNNPGWFYGFKEDIWQAYALGVTYHDLYMKEA